MVGDSNSKLTGETATVLEGVIDVDGAGVGVGDGDTGVKLDPTDLPRAVSEGELINGLEGLLLDPNSGIWAELSFPSANKVRDKI